MGSPPWKKKGSSARALAASAPEYIVLTPSKRTGSCRFWCTVGIGKREARTRECDTSQPTTMEPLTVCCPCGVVKVACTKPLNGSND